MRESATRIVPSAMPKRSPTRTRWRAGSRGGCTPSRVLRTTERAVSGRISRLSMSSGDPIGIGAGAPPEITVFTRTSRKCNVRGMASYLTEPFDRLPFGGADKARRYATERYQGAVGRNWYDCDPTLRFLMRRHLGDGFGWAEPRLREMGALMGGPIAERAEETDRNPPRLEKYDRWGRDISEVVMPPSFEAARRDIVATSFTRPDFVAEARRNGVDPAPLGVAWSYLLDQADIGMACALGTGGDMVVGLTEM